ncbi:hypothetical protein GGI52_005356 [Pseudomonas moraviensis]|uniref:Uncharacterized protein n=1 Tax=Pseudomonas moraviensis TaxID=321662 RepID=A0A7Y9W273_9PSED|nr:hypothetical protein [Pseudomonas moraviensis]
MKKILLINLPSETLLPDSYLQAKLRKAGLRFDAVQIDRSKSKAMFYVNNPEDLKGILCYVEEEVISSDFLESTSALGSIFSQE